MPDNVEDSDGLTPAMLLRLLVHIRDTSPELLHRPLLVWDGEFQPVMSAAALTGPTGKRQIVFGLLQGIPMAVVNGFTGGGTTGVQFGDNNIQTNHF
jgi:hypothetical protein